MSRTDLSESLAIVLLAAGSSSRLGQPKQLLRIEGEALVARTARRLLSLETAGVIVVTGYESSAVSDQLSGMPLQIVHNPDWQQGMGTSIARGVKQLPVAALGVLIMLCDQWRVDQADLELLFSAWCADISQIVVARWGSSGSADFGPPVIFPENMFHELAALQGDCGARPVIEKYRDRVEFVKMGHAAYDLDVPGDLEQYAG
jgi:molybdenum cofactor cytidylyltransferase